MKPWIIVSLVLLALIVLISPGIVGRLAERNVDASIERATQQGDVVVTKHVFDRGWFTSQGTHRVEIRSPTLRSLVAGAAGIDDERATPAFIVDTRVAHGIIPVASMARDSGSLQPGLASAVSTLRLDTGDGRLIDVPGRIHTQVGLSGATELTLLVEAGVLDVQGMRAGWNGVDIAVKQGASGDTLSYDGSVESLAIDDRQGGALRMGSLRFAGTLAATYDRAMVDAMISARLDHALNLAISDIETAGREPFDFTLDVTARADAAAVKALIAALTAARQASPAGAEFPDPVVASALWTLASRGVSLRVERLDVALAEGVIGLGMAVDLPPTELPEGPAWPSLLLATRASADLRVSAALVEGIVADNPEAGAVVALGYLKKEGDLYVTAAELARGILTVNGAPIPLSLPAE